MVGPSPKGCLVPRIVASDGARFLSLQHDNLKCSRWITMQKRMIIRLGGLGHNRCLYCSCSLTEPRTNSYQKHWLIIVSRNTTCCFSLNFIINIIIITIISIIIICLFLPCFPVCHNLTWEDLAPVVPQRCELR